MVPTGVEEEASATAPAPLLTVKTLRSRTARAAGGGTPGDASSSPDAMETEAAGQERRGRGRRGRRGSDVPVDKRERIKRRVKYLLIKMRTDRNLLDAYSREGWKGQSREKIRPEQELKRAEAQILRSKLAIREAIHELDDMGLEGSLDEDLFDDEGRIYHEEIFCAKCKSQEALLDNDIILCDGACNRGFHQYCLDPPLETKDIPPGDEGWLCPVCDCKMECVEAINADLGTHYEVENSWEDFFSKEAAGGGTQEGGDWPSSDSEDDDYDPEDSKESPVAVGGVTEVGIDVDWPSTDSEDDDFDPERGEKQGDSAEESESKDSGDDQEDGEVGEDSDSDSDFRENEASSGPSENDEQEPSGGTNNLKDLKKLARKGKRRRSSSNEESGSAQSSDSDDSDVSFFDEFKDGGAKSIRRDSQAEVSAEDEDAMVIEGKRHRKALDYKKLHDEMYGNTEDHDDDVISEDEDWGPKRRRRRTIPDDPSRPRPFRVRGRNLKTSSGDACKRVHADISKGVDPDASEGVDADGSKGIDADASKGVDADASKGVDADASKGVDADASKGVDADASKGVAADASKGVAADASKGVAADASKGFAADASKGVAADASKGVAADASKGVNADASKGVAADASKGVNADASKGVDADVSKGVVADGVPVDLLPGSQGGDGGVDTPGGNREKRMWRRLPDTAVEALRRVVAVTSLPSKSRKEELAAALGLSFTQVHGWFKNQRHQALRRGLEKPKRPHLVSSSSKGVNSVEDIETPATEDPATEFTIPQNGTSSNTVSNEKSAEEQLRLLELEHTLGVFDKNSVLIPGADGRTIAMDINFGNGGIGLPENGNRVVYAPAVTEVREQPPANNPC